MSVRIERLGHLGDGIAQGPVFAPMTLPGEDVTGEVINGRIAAPRIVTPSPDRVRPPCCHFRACGGCLVQHASDRFVAGWKRSLVQAALAAQGLDAAVLPTRTSPPKSRRRAALSARRTKKGALVGFHGRASGTIVEIGGCQLLHPALMAAIPALKALTVIGASRKAEISFTITRTLNGIDVVARGGKPLDRPLRAELAALAGQFGLARLTWGDDLVAELAPPVQRFGTAEVTPPAGAFLQATQDGEETLLCAVSDTVSGARTVLDLFAGCGTFSLPLAAGAAVHAVEGDAAMLAALDKGWRRAKGLKRVTTEVRDLFRRPLLAEELAAYDAVVIDPPRAGAQAQVGMLAQARVPVIASVSCNPASFARDARILVNAGYHLDRVQPVDQFRWSPHIEITARFTMS